MATVLAAPQSCAGTASGPLCRLRGKGRSPSAAGGRRFGLKLAQFEEFFRLGGHDVEVLVLGNEDVGHVLGPAEEEIRQDHPIDRLVADNHAQREALQWVEQQRHFLQSASFAAHKLDAYVPVTLGDVVQKNDSDRLRRFWHRRFFLAVLLADWACYADMTKAERAAPKLITTSRRERIARGSGTTVVDVSQLLKNFNQMQKMMQRMARAVLHLGRLPTLLRIDGNQRIPVHRLAGWFPAPRQETVVGGDLTVPAISAASIVAKTARDKLMQNRSAISGSWASVTPS